ncbi:Peroxin-3-domain-containing protein [Panaeolus papilionaceus]|nr:Peroxin-3-domain-containing protein [Panaeolus papilionaceus]
MGLKSFVYERRGGLLKTAGFLGGAYLAKGYLNDRLEEVKVKMEAERKGKESLQNRFTQTADDTSYTVLALLPTLAEQMKEHMDVETVTKELQSRSKGKAKALPISSPVPRLAHIPPQNILAVNPPPQSPPINSSSRPSSSLSSSQEGSSSAPSVAGVEGELAVNTSTSFEEIQASPSNPSDTPSESTPATQSWIVSSATSLDQQARDLHSPAPSSSVSMIEGADGEHLSASMISISATESSVMSYEPRPSNLAMSDSALSLGMSIMSDSSDSRSKAELWNEVKMLTLTRALTTIYSATLLSLLTTIQLALLARSKYVSSVIQQEKDERMREQMEEAMQRELSAGNMLLQFGLSFGSSWFGGKQDDSLEKFGKRIEDLLSGGTMPPNLADWETEEERRRGLDEEVSDETETKFLTLSWWLLHVGWKDVGERVRRGTEEVFEGVSLKTHLSPVDLHRLIRDVRRRVEHEVTFEGNEKRTNFFSSLLPPTPETIQHVLTQGGFSPSPSSAPSIYQSFADQDDQLQFEYHKVRPINPTNSSDLPPSSTLSSSELSKEFINSPALAVSNMHQTQNLRVDGLQDLKSTTYIPPPPVPPLHLLNDPPFNALLEETRTVLRSEDFLRVLEVALDKATEVLMAGIEKDLFGIGRGDIPSEERIRLAGLLPGLAKWSREVMLQLPNNLVDSVLAVREVSCLSAIIFGKFEDKFQ